MDFVLIQSLDWSSVKISFGRTEVLESDIRRCL